MKQKYVACCAAVIIGHITRLVRLSVCPVRAPKSKKHRKLKTKIGANVIQGNSVPICSSKSQKSGGRLHNMSAPGQHIFVVEKLFYFF